jgi:hypothetical protein
MDKLSFLGGVIRTLGSDCLSEELDDNSRVNRVLRTLLPMTECKEFPVLVQILCQLSDEDVDWLCSPLIDGLRTACFRRDHLSLKKLHAVKLRHPLTSEPRIIAERLCSPFPYTEAVQWLLDQGLLLPEHFERVLIGVAGAGHSELIKLLIERGVAHLDRAIVRASCNGHAEVLQLLLSVHPLRSNTVRDAIKAAARNGRAETLQLMLARCQNQDSLISDCTQALHAAVRAGYDTVLPLILNHLPEFSDHFRLDLLERACEEGHLSVLDYLLRFPTANGSSFRLTRETVSLMLHCAMKKNRAAVITRLFATGVEVNWDLPLRWTPPGSSYGDVMCVRLVLSHESHTEVTRRSLATQLLIKAVQVRDFDVTMLTLQYGADVTTSDFRPLYDACATGSLHFVIAILSAIHSVDADLAARYHQVLQDNNNDPVALFQTLSPQPGHLHVLLSQHYRERTVLVRDPALVTAAAAGEIRVVHSLLPVGSVPEFSIQSGALLAALKNRHPAVVRFICGGKPNVRTAASVCNMEALLLAAEQGEVNCLATCNLYSHAQVRLVAFCPMLIKAVDHQLSDIVQYLLEHILWMVGTEDGQLDVVMPAVYAAAVTGQVKLCRDICHHLQTAMVAAKQPIPIAVQEIIFALDDLQTVVDRDGGVVNGVVTPAVDRNYTQAQLELVQVVTVIAEHSSDWFYWDNLLVLAAKHGQASVVENILSRGANVRARYNAAMIGATEHNHAEVVRLLQERGACGGAPMDI